MIGHDSENVCVQLELIRLVDLLEKIICFREVVIQLIAFRSGDFLALIFVLNRRYLQASVQEIYIPFVDYDFLLLFETFAGMPPYFRRKKVTKK